MRTMLTGAGLWGLCLLGAGGLGAQAPGDTAMVLRGIAMRDTGAVWGLFLPTPVLFGAHRVHYLHVRGNTGTFPRFENRYVELSGVWHRDPPGLVSPDVWFDADRLKALTPPGERSHAIEPTFSQEAEISVAIIPDRFAFRDSTGGPSGVLPVLAYAVANHSNAAIDFQFRGNNVICATITNSPNGPPVWTHGWPAGPYHQNFTVNLGATVREAVTLPDSLTLGPGHYWMRMGLCELSNYDGIIEFDVSAP
ncbi:MAG TPA: hypothetical protein VI160_09920 [Gemmatimonadales bacterium]